MEGIIMSKDIKKSEAFIIGEKIKELRRLKGLTQEELSEKIGIDYKKLSRIETGRCLPSLKIAQALSKEFEFNFCSLFDNEVNEKIEIPDNYFVQALNILKSAKTKQERIYYLEALKHTQKCLKINLYSNK